MATLLSIQIGRPTTYGIEGASDPMDGPWSTSFFKLPISGPVNVGKTNIVGDEQTDLINHGGVDKAVLAYSSGHYENWKQELGLDVMPYGAFGENLTIDGFDETTVHIGDRYQIGTAEFEVSQPRQPCWKLARRWRIKDLPARVIDSCRGGWYFRVVKEGIIQAGDSVIRTASPRPNWPVRRVFRVFYKKENDPQSLSQLIEVKELSSNWREELAARRDKLLSS